MTLLEKLQAAAEPLSDSQIEALVAFARSMRSAPFYNDAPPEALASIERGLAQIARDDTLTVEQLAVRLDQITNSADT